MPRTSPVHYINPSSISLTANANGSANDIAVYIERNAKIKVYSPKVGLNLSSGDYQEWSLRGRNRRLANSAKKYAIYARLRHSDHEDGYLVFAAMEQYTEGPRAGQWYEKYWHVGPEGWEGGYEDEDGWAVIEPDPTYWYIKLGEVSLPENHQRTIDLDTGILGTEQFNTEWALNPDALPLRIELGCTIGDEDAGPTPYVYWGQSLVLTAMLTEGWTGTDIQRFDRWEIIRNSGDAAADNTWNYQQVEGEDTLAPRLMPDGQITLQHIFGGTDDFNGAVSVTFTILAVGHTVDTLQREILKTVTINIMVETVATYELEQSSAAVTYNPLDNTYSPANVVTFRIRTKAQDGSVSFADDSHIALAQLRLYALPEGDAAESRTRLTFTGGTATLPVTAFAGKSINLWLENGAQVVLARTTVAYIRYGEKGDTPISIYRWYKVGLTPLKPTSTSSEEPAPAAGDATGAANVYPTDKWGKTAPDRPATGEWALWMCGSIRHGNGAIDAWSTPVRISGDKGTAGEDGSDREYIYIRQNTFPFSGTLPASITTPDASSTGQTVADDDFVPNGWSDTALPADNDNRYVYMSVREKPAGEDQTWGPFGNPVLWSNWGVRGTDGDGTEYVFIRTQNNVAPIMDSVQTGYASDEFRPTITSASQTASLTEQAQTTDDPKGPNSTYPYEWVATRSKGAAAPDGTRQWTKYTGKNNDYTMSLWSRWAEDGEPSVSYYIKTNVDSVTIPADSSQINIELNGEFHKVTGSTDEVHSCAFVLYARKTDGQRNAIAHASSVGGYSVSVTATPDIQAYEALMQETLVNDPTVYLARKEIIVQKHGDTGPKGDDAQEVSPNILLRTIFDRGIDFVLEAWTRNSELIAIDGTTDTIVNGRKSLRMNASALSQYLDFQQNVFGKVKPSTWYTLSFNSFATQSFHTFLYDASNTTPWIDLSEGYYIDGSATPTAVTRIDGFHEWEANWSGNRHSITFKTASTFSTTTLYVLFRCLQGGQVAICMPKLEEGRVATAYMAHEDDLKGDNAPYNEHAYALSRSRTSHADGDLYQVNGVRWFPSAPDPRATHPYVWERIMHYTAAGLNDQTSYICLTGAVGAMGKLCYIAGEYSEDVEYTSNDSQTVAVEVSGTNDTTDIYYLNAESNVVDGTHISPTDGVVIDGKPVWVQGMSQYNLVRARYLFADFAQFGAAVVSGDWLISAHGTINGTEYHGKYEDPDTYINSGDEKPTYFWFDPAYPNEDHAGKDKVPGSPSEGQWASDHHNFIPHYAVNLLTGKTYQNDAVVRGVVDVRGSFKGLVTANAFYSDAEYLIGGDYIIDMVNNPHAFFVSKYKFADVTLPNPNSYEGLELQFFHILGPRSGVGWIKFLDTIYFLEVDQYGNRNTGSLTNAYAMPNTIIRLKAIDNRWWLADGELHT